MPETPEKVQSGNVYKNTKRLNEKDSLSHSQGYTQVLHMLYAFYPLYATTCPQNKHWLCTNCAQTVDNIAIKLILHTDCPQNINRLVLTVDKLSYLAISAL